MLNNRPGLRIAVYFAIGIFAASYPGFSFYRTIGLLAFIVVLFFGLSYFAKSSTASHAFLFLLVFTAGYGRMSVNSYELLPQSHLLNLDIFDTEVMLSGWIKDRRDYSSGNSTITVAILSLQSGNRRYAPVEGDINISLPFSSAGDSSDYGGKDSYSYGDEVTVSGTLVRPPARRNPGEFDYRSYLERNGIYGQLRRSSGSLLEIKESNYGNLLVREVVVPVRDALSSTLSNFHSGQYLEFMRAILLGQRSGMEPEIMEDFKDTGTLHILAVSGLHIGFVAVLLFGILRVFPFSRPVVLSMMIIAIILYIFVTGAKPPVMRAGIYLIVYCFGIITQRLRDPLNILGITVVILLLINPADLFDAGFQLSVFSILGIMFLTNYFRSGLDNYTGLKNYMRNKWDDIFRRNLFRVGFLLIVSIGAFLGTSVVMAYHFHRLMPGGIVLSLIIVPAASIIVGLGFIEIIIGSIIPVVGNAIKTSIELLINGIFWLNRNAADIPGVNFTVGQDEIIWVVISITLAIVSVTVFSPDKRNRIKINSSGNRHRLKIISGFAVILVIWGMWWTKPDGLMRVQFLDVGQGDAAVVSFPDGTNYLIDGGDNRDGWDSGKRHIIPFLRWAGIRQLDGVFLSHPNRDHYGGLASVFESVSVDTLYESMDSRLFLKDNPFTLSVGNQHIPRKLVGSGDIIGTGKNWQIYVLSPYIEDQSTVNYEDANDYSMVLLIKYGESTFLFTGDISAEQEVILLKQYGSLLDSDVLKVSHHGSKFSSDDDFIQAVSPDYAVITSGRFNSYGHPTPQTLNRLEAVRSQIFRMGRDGSVGFESDGNKITVKR